MRQIGTLPDPVQAERFAAYLITRGMTATVEPEGGAVGIWVREEDHVDEARAALEQFRQEPEHPRYQAAVREALSRLQEQEAQQRQARRNLIVFRGRWQRQGFRRHPLVATTITLCVVVFFLSGLGRNPRSAARRMLGFCDTMQRSDWDATQLNDRLINIRSGQVWRLITPVFLHGDLLHLAFNMMVFYSLAGQIEERRGTWRLAVLMLAVALVSNLAQGLAPSDWGPMSGGPWFCGLSGVVFGLLGYLWMKTVYQPEAGLWVSSGTVLFLLMFMALGFTGVLTPLVGPLANLAHLGGLLAGMAVGYGTSPR